MGYKILSKKELCPNQFEITVDAPYVVRNAKAGQFIIFRAEDNGERVPLTIADVNKETGALTLVFMAVGYSTKKLATLEVGDELVDIVGPLGQPTHIKKYGTVVCLAGGYGAAPCYLIAKAFKEAGNKVYMIMGARTKDLIFWQDKMKDACTELFITTDDGTAITPDNASWATPVTASESFQGERLKRKLTDYVQSMPDIITAYGGAPIEYFTIYIEPLGSGSYRIYFLY